MNAILRESWKVAPFHCKNKAQIERDAHLRPFELVPSESEGN